VLWGVPKADVVPPGFPKRDITQQRFTTRMICVLREKSGDVNCLEKF